MPARVQIHVSKSANCCAFPTLRLAALRPGKLARRAICGQDASSSAMDWDTVKNAVALAIAPWQPSAKNRSDPHGLGRILPAPALADERHACRGDERIYRCQPLRRLDTERRDEQYSHRRHSRSPK